MDWSLPRLFSRLSEVAEPSSWPIATNVTISSRETGGGQPGFLELGVETGNRATRWARLSGGWQPRPPVTEADITEHCAFIESRSKQWDADLSAFLGC